MAAVTREMKSFMSHAARTEVAPNLTMTNFLDGMITTYCSWYPLAAKASLGALGQIRSLGFPSVPAFNQKRAPYCPCGALGVGVALYFTHPSGRILSPSQTPSCR